MALVHVGTATTTSLYPAIKFLPGYGSGMSAADIASISQAIKDDKNVAHPRVAQQPFSANGLLYIPNRGVLTMLPGDYVAVDSRGWPVLLSADTIANGPWSVS